jgi:predicted 2-oxoglutarate/Fe(II)-dependent dioxygenase YbiX
MPNLSERLATLLKQVRRPGSFYATGTFDLHPPRLEVEGIGAIALPLLASQAEQIIASAEQAPYGRGTETLIDTEVRRTWQLGAERVRISGRAWQQGLAEVVDQAAAGLGVTAPVEAQLYKLLIYDTGSFFIRHRDSEKAQGMFATLVVVLPSEYSGGEIVVRHRGQEAHLDLRRDEPSEAAYAAFYADCVHEVLPIASGYRLALIYNLVRKGRGALPQPPDYGAEQQGAATVLRTWSGQPDSPTKLIYPLEHAYTPAELGFATLKGADAPVAEVLLQAARQAQCELYLALVSVRESGIAEHYTDYSRRGRYADYDDDDFEIVEVTDSSETVGEWRHPDGSRPPLGALSFDPATEISPPGAFDDPEWDELDFQEATGNEGASFDRLYQRAALVLWPRTHRMAVFAQGGLSFSIPFLGQMVQEWLASGDGAATPAWQEAHQLAGLIRDGWPTSAWERQHLSKDGQSAALLRHLTRLADSAEIDAFVSQQSATGAYGGDDNEALVPALGLLPPARAAELLEAVVGRNALQKPAACADLLARAAVAGAASPTLLRPAALALLQCLPGGDRRPPEAGGERPGKATVALLVDLLAGLEYIDPALAGQAIEHVLTHPSDYPLDGILVPAVLRLNETETMRRFPSAGTLRNAVLDHLRRRIAEPLEPPADWRRPSEIRCSCGRCRELSRFLADPHQPVWLLKAAAHERSHVEDSIRNSHCDLDCTTEQKGRPYSLRCTKNQASYQRRVKQRREDQQHLAALEG